jgi:hypothetical protein
MTRKIRDVWLEQCRLALDIRSSHGVEAAFDYLVSDALMEFAKAAAAHPEFARQLPWFVSSAREMFSPDETQLNVARVESRMADEATAGNARGLQERRVEMAERSQRFEFIKALMLEVELGTS